MFIQINPSDNTPVYEQIVRQVKFAVAGKTYGPGDQIPSVRQLSVDLLVNPNTVSKAYRELDREGIIFTKRGVGLFVTDNAPALCRKHRREILSATIAQAIDAAVRAGLSRDEVERLVQRALDAALQRRGR